MVLNSGSSIWHYTCQKPIDKLEYILLFNIYIYVLVIFRGLLKLNKSTKKVFQDSKGVQDLFPNILIYLFRFAGTCLQIGNHKKSDEVQLYPLNQ